MMKKRFSLLFAVLLLLLGTLILSACTKDKDPQETACTHEWGEWTVKTAATCSAEGTEERVCSLCKATDSRSVARTAHQYDTKWIGTAEGHHHKCLNCDAVTGSENHNPGPEATANSSQVCLDCGYILVHARAHSLTRVEEVAPTCLTGGNVEYWHCEDCGANFADSEGKAQVGDPALAALGHTWNIEDPGCEDDLTCTVCQAVQLAQGHRYELTGSTTLSCTEDGSVTYTCTECGHAYTQILAKAPGHQLGVWQAEGDPVRLGESCNYTQFYHADCANEGCDGADKSETLTIHHYGAAVLTSPATCSTHGTKTYTCEDCGTTRTENFDDASAHIWDNGKTVNGNTVYTCTATGCRKTKTVYNSSSAVIASGDLTDEIALKDAALSLDETVKNKLGANTTFTAEKISLDDLKTELGAGADYIKDDALVFEFGILSDGSTVSFDGGKVTVRIPYELGEDDDPDNIAVFYIDNDGQLKFYNAKYVGGFAVFEADHFSTYTVTRLTVEERCALYGHAYRDTVIAPSCEEEGYTISVCLRCRHIEKRFILPALGHNWEVISETKDTVDCTHSKTIVSRCRNCNEEAVDYTPALGHDWVESDRTDASCTAAGSVKKTCNTCHASFTETIPQRAHSYTSVITDATCTTDGYTTNTCTVCGHVVKTNFVTAPGHNFRETIVAPTCTENGYTLMECRSCDYSCRINVTPAAHTWDRDEADCGHAKACIICGAVGAPATGNHQMVNGICSVCGEGCSHEFVTSTVEAGCEERGYTLEKCGKCGLEKKSNYTDALGHTGVVSCTRCGKALLSDEYFGRLLLDNNLTQFNLCLNELVIRAPYRDYTPNNFYVTGEMILTIRFAEMVLSFDEDGNLTGSALGQITVQRGFEHPTLQFRAALRDGVLYFNYEGQPDSVFSSGSFREYVDMMTKAFARIPLEELLKYLLPGNDETSGMADTVFAMLPQLTEMFKSLKDIQMSTEDYVTVGKAVRQFVVAFFDVTRDGEDVIFTFSFEKLRDFLLSDTIADMIDYVCGEGTFESIKEGVLSLGDCTVAQLVKKINDLGIDQNKIYAKLNETIASLTGGECETAEDLLRSLGIDFGTKEDGTPVTLLDLLNQLIDSRQTLFEIAVDKINESAEPGETITVDGLKAAIASMFDEYGAVNPIQLILSLSHSGSDDDNNGGNISQIRSAKYEDASADAGNAVSYEDIVAAIRHYTGLLGKDFCISVTAGKDAKVKSLDFELDMDVSEYAGEDTEGSVRLSLSFPTAYASKLDIETFLREATGKTDIRLTEKALSKFLRDSRYTFEFDEDGNLIAFTPADSVYPESIGLHIPSSNIYYIGTGTDEDGTPYLLRVYSETSYRISANPLLLVVEDCGTNVILSIPVQRVTTYSVFKYYGETKAPVAYDGEYDGRYENELTAKIHQDSLTLLYNTKTGKVQSFVEDDDDTDTLHIWEVTETVDAVGCEGVGEIHYTCAECGKTAVKYYINGHRNVSTTGEFLTEKKSCTAGIRITNTCDDCGKVLSVETVNYHKAITLAKYDVSKETLGEIGSVCGGTVIVEGCLCGVFGPYINTENLECDSFPEWRHVSLKIGNELYDCEIDVCSVTDPVACGFVWGRYTGNTYRDGCMLKQKEYYFFGATYVGTDSAEDDRPLYTLAENSLILNGNTVYERHDPLQWNEGSKSVSLPGGGTVSVPVRTCASCGRFNGYLYETVGDNHTVSIDYSGDGAAYNLYIDEYLPTGEMHLIENTDEDGVLQFRRLETVTYGRDGKRCTGIRVTQYGDNRPEETEEFDGCDMDMREFVKRPTCTGRGSYYSVCAHCGYRSAVLEFTRPNGHDKFYYNSETGMFVCGTCGLESKSGMNGSILMEDLTEAGSGYCSVGYYCEKEPYLFQPYLSLVSEDGTELVLTEFDSFLYFADDYQNSIGFHTEAALEAIAKEYAGLNGTYRLKLTFVPDNDKYSLDYAITFDEVFTFTNGSLAEN